MLPKILFFVNIGFLKKRIKIRGNKSKKRKKTICNRRLLVTVCRRLSAGWGHAGRSGVRTKSSACPSKPSKRRVAAGQQGQRALTRRDQARDRRGARVRDRITRFKSRSGRAKRGYRVRARSRSPVEAGSGPVPKPQRGNSNAGKLHPETQVPSAYFREGRVLRRPRD